MIRLISILGLILLFSVASAEIPLSTKGSEHPDIPIACDDFYSQDPDYESVYNMSSGFDSEIADDIPGEFAGQTIRQLTLWVGEWSGDWQDPDGITVNFYDSICPPAMVPVISFMIPWDQWDKELVYNGIAMVYRVTGDLPQEIEILPQMSIGGFVNISWGSNEPFTGLCATPFYTTYGECVAYLDADNWGYERWTAIDHYTQIPQDFAYGLSEEATSIDDEHNTTPNSITISQNYPNPFNASTEISFTLAEPAYVTLEIFNIAGQKIDMLVNKLMEAGPHSVLWHASGYPTGMYFYNIKVDSYSETKKMLLLK